MLGLNESPYDLKFRLLNIPVRVQPMFWLVTAMLGFNSSDHNLAIVLMWVGCVFVSVLVHEFGHGLMARRFGSSASIVLWGFGGLCYNEAERQTRAQRMAVILSGPGAGFLLCGLVMLLASLRFGVTASEHLGVALTTVGFSSHRMQAAFAFMKLELPWAEKTQWAQELYWQMVYINLMWGLVNLLPIWPLDGGRFSEIVLTSYDRGRGQRWNHVLSLLVSGCLAAFIYMRTESVYNSIFFGVFALMNYQQLQQMQQSSSMGYSRDDDWWRR